MVNNKTKIVAIDLIQGATVMAILLALKLEGITLWLSFLTILIILIGFESYWLYPRMMED